MATAPSPLVDQERPMMSAGPTASSPAAEAEKRTLNPLLVAMLIALAAFPFLVTLLPEPVVKHLDVLFH